LSETTLYIEPFGGLAGDMLLAALLDLEDERFALADLRALAEALVPGESELSLEPAVRGSIAGRLLTVRTGESDHPPHRHLADCAALIEGAPLSDEAKRRATSVFRRIAEAEARVHGTTIEAVHFHEVGAVDALVDICGAAHALDRLAVARVVATPPLVGSGTVRCAHGEMPVPAPGTAELLRGLPVTPGGEGERLTPTGAALLAEYVESFEPPETFVADRVGYGAGRRDPRSGPPNLVRVQLGRAGGPGAGVAWLAEVNLDDMTGEEVGFLLAQLRAAGALEAWAAPVQMKKDRPGVIVSALVRKDRRDRLERALFAHSTTLGVRWTRHARTECARETLEVEVLGHAVRVKRRLRPGAEGGPPIGVDFKPEHDDLARAAEAAGRPLRELAELAREAALRATRGPG
jgi:uncharacterized protein (TIGR00299 family) protein